MGEESRSWGMFSTLTVSIINYTEEPARRIRIRFLNTLSFTALEIRTGYHRSLYCVEHGFAKAEVLFSERSNSWVRD